MVSHKLWYYVTFFLRVSTGNGVINFVFYHLSTVFVLLPSQFLPTPLSATATARISPRPPSQVDMHVYPDLCHIRSLILNAKAMLLPLLEAPLQETDIELLFVGRPSPFRCGWDTFVRLNPPPLLCLTSHPLSLSYVLHVTSCTPLRTTFIYMKTAPSILPKARVGQSSLPMRHNIAWHLSTRSDRTRSSAGSKRHYSCNKTYSG